MRERNIELLYVDLTEIDATKQIIGDKLCMAHAASMAMGTDVDNFLNFLKTISIEYKNIRTEPGFSLIELKLYCLKFDKDIHVTKGNPKNEHGPAVIVVHSEHYKDVLHAIYMDEKNFIYDPNPDTPDGRNISTYKVVEWYDIIPFNDD